MHAVILETQVQVKGTITSRVLEILPQLEGRRRWVGARGDKALVCEPSEHNITLLEAAGVKIAGREKPPVDPGPAPDPFAETLYRPKSTPFEHQLRALAAMANKKAFALFMEQGTGKTKTWIDRAGQLFSDGEITGMLVVSKKGPHRQWAESELDDHCAVPYRSAFWPVKLLPPILAEQGRSLKVLTFNYDGLKTVRGREVALEFCTAHRGKLLIVADESQEIKDKTTSRHTAMMALRPFAKYAGLATGTPIAKNLLDEWSQLLWLDEKIIGIRYKTTFLSRYCVLGGWKGKDVIGHRNVEEFKAITAPAVFRATKDDIGILPKQYARWGYDLSDVQRRMMRELKEDLETEIAATGTMLETPLPVTRLVKFQQIASGFAIDEAGIIHRIVPTEQNPRLQAALEYLDADESPAIVWFRFREEGRMLAEALEAAGIGFVEYHGGTSDKDRQIAKERFLAGEAKVFLANPQSAGTGLNLQGRCTRALYYSNSFAAIDRWQSEDRIHRIGTKGICVFTDLVGKGTLDSYILRNLKQKKTLSRIVLDDVQEILEELQE